MQELQRDIRLHHRRRERDRPGHRAPTAAAPNLGVKLPVTRKSQQTAEHHDPERAQGRHNESVSHRDTKTHGGVLV